MQWCGRRSTVWCADTSDPTIDQLSRVNVGSALCDHFTLMARYSSCTCHSMQSAGIFCICTRFSERISSERIFSDARRMRRAFEKLYQPAQLSSAGSACCGCGGMRATLRVEGAPQEAAQPVDLR